MNRDKNLPLTETVYYILLALAEPAHGYAVMIIQRDLIDPGKARIVCDDIHETTDEIVW